MAWQGVKEILLKSDPKAFSGFFLAISRILKSATMDCASGSNSRIDFLSETLYTSASRVLILSLRFLPVMNTFSLLQLSLDQSIERHAFEDASAAVASVARADCAMLHRDLYGVVVSNLTEDEALAFQAELTQRNFPTTLVADSDLPVLQESFQVQRIELQEENINLTDSMGHLRVRPVSDLCFLAAGFVKRLHFNSDWDQHLEAGIDSHGSVRLVTERTHHEESELEFRLDFFFKSTPERQHTNLCKDSMIFHQGKPLLLRDAAGLLELSKAMANLLPAEAVNRFLRNPESRSHYPTFHGYREEIIWHFHQLGLFSS
jgi:hypothetical protein